MKPAKILFFVQGVAPTAEDFEAASKLTAQVVFRNAQAVPAEGALEECDGVAGAVPAPYAELPTAEEAIAKKAEEIAALAKKVGDEPAPKAPAKAQSKPANAPQAGKPATPPAWTPNGQ